VAPLLLSVALPLVALAPLLFALPTLLLDAAPVAHHVVLQLLSPLPELGVAVVASFQEVHEFQEFTVDGLVLLIQHTLQLAHGVKVGAPVDLGDGGACLPRTSSASNAVQLVVQVLRHVEVHNQVTLGRSSPLAATSVAMSTRMWPLVNWEIIFCRVIWALSECSTPGDMLLVRRKASKLSQVSLRLQKIMALLFLRS